MDAPEDMQQEDTGKSEHTGQQPCAIKSMEQTERISETGLHCYYALSTLHLYEEMMRTVNSTNLASFSHKAALIWPERIPSTQKEQVQLYS